MSSCGFLKMFINALCSWNTAPHATHQILQAPKKCKKIQVFNWQGSSLDQNPVENLWMILKNKVSEKQPSSLNQPENVMNLFRRVK